MQVANCKLLFLLNCRIITIFSILIAIGLSVEIALMSFGFVFLELKMGNLPATAISPAEVLATLRVAVDKAGSQRTYAAKAGIRQAYLCDVLHGRRAAGDKILGVLGLKRVTVIAAVEDC